MKVDILLHEDVALADIKGALFHLCETPRILFGRRLSFTLESLQCVM